MSWFQRSVKAGVDKALNDYFAPGGEGPKLIERTVWEQMDLQLSRTATLTPLGWLWALKLCFRKHGSSFAEASDLAVETFKAFLADEKIKFGDPAYAWTREGAEEVAEEYELRHWEDA